MRADSYRYNLVEKPHAGPALLHTGVLATLNKWSWIILVLGAIVQLTVFYSQDNFWAVMSIILAWALTTSTFLNTKTLQSYPLSSFILLGFVATQFYLPLLATTFEKKPVIFNLLMPREVFIHSLLCLMILLFAHRIYTFLLTRPVRKFSATLSKLGVFTPPGHNQLWSMGLAGIGATLYTFVFSQSGTEVTGAASDKIIESLIPFTYAPFFIPCGKLYGVTAPIKKTTVIKLVAFTFLLFAVSIARNSRGSFMIGFTSVAFAYFLGLMLGVYRLKIFTVRNVVAAAFCGWLFVGPIADLGTAMVIVRSERHNIPSSQLVSLTLRAFNDKEEIRKTRLESTSDVIDWDENYLDNIFLARFCNIKFNDASLEDASKIDIPNQKMFDFNIERILAIFPEPVIAKFNLSVDKKFVNSVSFGDYLHYVAGADPETLGRLVTGHIAGTGMASFGWWYLPILGVGMIFVFFLFDSLSIYRPNNSPLFSLCGLLYLTHVFIFTNAESVVAPVNFIIREWLQLVILYLIIYHSTRFLNKKKGQNITRTKFQS